MVDREKVIHKLEKSLKEMRANRICIEDVIELEEAAYDALALLKEQEARWIPVTERLPDEGNDVIAWEKQGFPYIDFVRGGEWVVASDQYAIVTHWMPLPEPPKEEQDAE